MIENQIMIYYLYVTVCTRLTGRPIHVYAIIAIS